MREPTARLTRRHSPAIFHAGALRVLLPMPGWWLLHEASKPTAVCKAAGLDFDKTWRVWKKLAASKSLDWQTMRRWLYWHALPPSERRRYIELGIIRKVGQVEWCSDGDMRSFRRYSNWRAVGHAARQARKGAEGISVNAAIQRAARLSVELAWLPSWIAEGEDPPDGVRIVTDAELRRLLAAFDFASSGLGAYYDRWFGGSRQHPRALFPAKSGAELYEWVRFAFGGPPPNGYFVIAETHERIRRAAVPEALAEAAGVGAGGHAARSLRKLSAESVGGHASNRASLAARAALEKAAVDKASTVAAICRRANVDQSVYHSAIKEAESIGAATAVSFKRFLNGDEGRRLAKLTGEIAPGVFRSPEKLIEFRSASRERIRESKADVWALATLLPAFEKIAVDLAVPRVKNGKRSGYPWLKEFLEGGPELPAGNRARPSVASDQAPAGAAAVPDTLDDDDREIVQAIEQLEVRHPRDTFTAEAISIRVGRPNNSNFRRRLARMAERGAILKQRFGRRGYRLTALSE